MRKVGLRSSSPKSSSSHIQKSHHCLVCECEAAIQGDDAQAHAYEMTARKRLLERAEPWKTYCGRDQPFVLWDPDGAVRSINNVRTALERKLAVAEVAKQRALVFAQIKFRREKMLEHSREAARKKREAEQALRSVDADFVARQSSFIKLSSPLKKGVSSPKSAAPVAPLRLVSPTPPTTVQTASPALTPRPWSARTYPRLTAAGRDELERPQCLSSVNDHFKRLAIPPLDTRSMDLPSPPVAVTPLPPPGPKPPTPKTSPSLRCRPATAGKNAAS